MRLAVLPDFPEERWPSMELVGEMLLAGLPAYRDIRFQRALPPFRRRAARLPLAGGWAHNVDRLINRMRDYPRFVRSRRDDFDFFHVVDHSYSQLLHAVPAGRGGVFCHDLDTFRSVLSPEVERRAWWFRRMTRRILDGFRRAAVVFYSTDVVRRQILDAGLADEARLVKAPYGIAPEFRPGDDLDAVPASIRDRLGLGASQGPMLLHVGSTIARKRIDVLLESFARLRRDVPDAWLVQVGGEWTAEQTRLIASLGIESGVVRTGRLPSRAPIAELYRRAALVLMPSSSEGFGLPVAEALACGAIVLASDIPVFREVGGEAVLYAPLADVEAWSEAIRQTLAAPERAPSREARLARAGLFTWTRHVETIVGAYQRLERGLAPS